MAGDWIKMRVNLSSDPQVIKVARLLDCSEFKVVGLLHWLWGWADAHTNDGKAVGIDCEWINRQAGTPDFCEALEKVGWLILQEDGIEIPNFSNHNGASAKARAGSARRAATYKTRHKDKDKPEPKPSQVLSVVPKATVSKSKKNHGKVGPIMKLLEGCYAHLLEDPDKVDNLKLWVNHLSQRLDKKYSDPGARALLKRIEGFTPEELDRGVQHSLEGNWQKLVIPKENYGQKPTKGSGGKNISRFKEYED